MLNEKDGKAMDRFAKYFYPFALISTPLVHMGLFDWLAPHVQTLFHSLQSYFPALYPYLIGIALLGFGWAAFQIKTRWRWYYGAAELAIAYLSGIAWFRSSVEFGVKELLAGAAVVYLVVRGLDNMREAKKAKALAKAIALPSSIIIRSD